MRARLLSILLALGLVLAGAVHASAQRLDGPWAFRTGDDVAWKAPDLDDSGWETISLAAAPDAHDSDVGLKGYVAGWRARGHDGYSGYAWYRMHVRLPAGDRPALLASAYVEDVYQVYWNGTYIGGSGDFRHAVPVVYSTRPTLLPLPPGSTEGVVAIRVWMAPGDSREADAGGIHIAPAVGDMATLMPLYREQWRQTFVGYVVDAVEPLLFCLLAGLVWWRQPAAVAARFTVALVLTAALRVNQATYAWGAFESLPIYMLARQVLIPLGVVAWALAWQAWLGLDKPVWRAWAGYAAAAIATVVMLPGGELSAAARIAMAVVFAAMTVDAMAGRNTRPRLTALAIVLLSVGLFAGELSSLNVPGIWFPFGVGVSRTQFAYAGLIAVLAVLFVRPAYRTIAISH